MLNILLQGNCSREMVSDLVTVAMNLKSRPSRLQVVRSIVEKGVLPQTLGIPLQSSVSEDGKVDLELIQLLLQRKAPIDDIGNDADNCVLLASRKGNLSVLKMLCDAGPQVETLSMAVPVAFGTIHDCGYDVALGMIKLLLDKRAAGVPIHDTLLAAASQDYRLDIVRALVEHGADANHQGGAPFVVALVNKNVKLLEILCVGCPPSQASTESVLSKAIDPRWYNAEALQLLLSYTSSSAAALNSSWALERFKGNPNITPIVPCSLRHGLDVNIGNRTLLCSAIQDGNFVLFKNILS